MLSTLYVTFVLCQCIYASTEYPLYAIFDGGDKLTTNDFKLITATFKAAQAGVNSSVATQIHSMNNNFQIVRYTDDYAILNLTDGEYNKSNPLRYGFGTLLSSLTASSSETTVKVKLFSHFTQIPFKKSTTTAQYSKNCKSAVTWIRINNEYMKVINIDNTHKQLTVQRGFIGNGSSKPVLSSHAQNTTIFAPVYFTSPPGTSQCTNTYRYMLNPESEYAITHYGDMVYSDIKNGLNGAWYDNWGGYPPFPLDGLDNDLSETLIWDENNNDYFKDCNQYRVAQQNRLTATYNYLSTKYKLSPDSVTIWANNMASQHYNKCDLYKFLQKTSSFPYPLDGYCMEGYSVHQSGTCDNNQIEWLELDKWTSNVDELINVTARGIAGMPMIAQAGCKAKGIGQLSDEMYEKVILFGYVTYLMGVNSRNSLAYFGVPALREKENKIWYAYVEDVFFYKIGNPSETKASVSEYKINGHISYQRFFENGIVVVNPNNKTDNGISLSKEYINPKTNETVKNLNVAAHTAYILLNQ